LVLTLEPAAPGPLLPMSREQTNLFFQVVSRHKRLDDPYFESHLRQLGQRLSPVTACSRLAMLDRNALDHRQDQRRELPPQGQAQGTSAGPSSQSRKKGLD